MAQSPRFRSIGAYVRELDCLAPFRGFVGDHLAEVLGRAAYDQHSHLGKPLLDLGIGEAAVDLGIELVDDLAWRARSGIAKGDPLFTPSPA